MQRYVTYHLPKSKLEPKSTISVAFLQITKTEKLQQPKNYNKIGFRNIFSLTLQPKATDSVSKIILTTEKSLSVLLFRTEKRK